MPHDLGAQVDEVHARDVQGESQPFSHGELGAAAQERSARGQVLDHVTDRAAIAAPHDGNRRNPSSFVTSSFQERLDHFADFSAGTCAHVSSPARTMAHVGAVAPRSMQCVFDGKTEPFGST